MDAPRALLLIQKVAIGDIGIYVVTAEKELRTDFTIIITMMERTTMI